MPEHIEEVDCTIHVGSGNVFADLGMADPELRRAKALVSILVEKQIDQLAIPMAAAAARTGLTETELSRMVRGVNSAFGIGRMLEALAVLDAEGRADGEFCLAVRHDLVEALEVLRGMRAGQEAHEAEKRCAADEMSHAATVLGANAESSSVEFAFAAQAETVLSDDRDYGLDTGC